MRVRDRDFNNERFRVMTSLEVETSMFWFTRNSECGSHTYVSPSLISEFAGFLSFILRYDVRTPEVWSQKSTAEMSLARQRHARHFSAATDRHDSNRGVVGDGDFYSDRLGIIKGGHVIYSFVGNIRSLKLAAVKHTAGQVTRLPL
jgi:hypothetical protein